MNINFTFDNSTNPSDLNSWANAPVGLEATAQSAVQAVASLYSILFANNVTLNITFQWGATNPGTAASNNGGGGDLIFSYSQLKSLLQADEGTQAQTVAFSNLPNTDPTGSNNFALTVAEAQALGVQNVNALYQQAYGSPPPGGTVTFSNGQNWTYNQFFNAAAHEISEIMGRFSLVGVIYSGPGSPNGPETNQPLYQPLDLFRYTASGSLDTTIGTNPNTQYAFFGYDGQIFNTNLAFNNLSNGGDRGDWALTPPFGDTFGAVSSNAGVLSGTDITMMNLLGWNLGALTALQAVIVYELDPTNNQYGPGLPLVVLDSSSNVSNAIDSLETLLTAGDLTSISLTDSAPTITVTGAQLVSDAAVFPTITGFYDLSVNLSGNPIKATLPANVEHVTLTGSGGATLVVSGTGSYVVDNKAGAVTLDYSSVTGALFVDVPDSFVHEPGATDTFTNVQGFTGGSGFNLFASTNTGYYTFNGQGAHNTLDYSADPNGVTINLTTDTVTKDPIFIHFTVTNWQDSFSDIQNFVGGSGTNTFIIGAAGNDGLTGGSGVNHFVFETAALAAAQAATPSFVSITNFDLGKGGSFNPSEGDQIDLSALLGTAYAEGSGLPVGSLVQAVEARFGVVAELQVDPSGVPNGWVTIANLDGVLPGNVLNIILDPSLLAGTSITVQEAPSIFTGHFIQIDYIGITRTALSLDQATTEANAINAGTTTETQYINSLLSQVVDTTIPVVAVEASMYGAVGSSAVITNLVTNFLPGQLAYAHQVGLDPQTLACLETALVFAFSNEAGATTFANNYGPSNTAMPATAAGDAAFAAAATNAIFGSAQTANTAPAILGYVHFLEGFFTANGIVGVQNPTPDQIVIAARAGAWGEGIAIAEGNNLGPFPGQTTNFLEDAAQGTAIYSAPFSSQPTAAQFQGAATAFVASTASSIQVTGVAAHVDHIVM